METVTVAIVTRNRAKSLRRCLNSILSQTVAPYEVIVIDNSSSDDTKQVVKDFKNRLVLRYIYERKVGIPYARNRALKEAKGKILAFIDDDCEATSSWVVNVIRAHAKFKNAAVVQGMCKEIKQSGAVSRLSQYYHDTWIKSNLDKDKSLYILDTKNASIKLSRCRNIKFDTNFPRGSDVDFGTQLLVRGEKIIYYPKCVVKFSARSNIVSFLIQRFLIGISHVRKDFKWTQDYFILDRFKMLKRRGQVVVDVKKSIPFVIADFLAKLALELGRNYEMTRVMHDYSRLNRSNNNLGGKILKDNKNIKLSVMIITMDRYDDLTRCLNSLEQQTIKPYEVIIVDSSRRKRPEVIKPFLKALPIKYFQESRFGFGLQRNIALEKASGAVGAILDDDSEAASDWCEQLILAHNNFPQAIAIQGSITSQSKNEVYKILEQVRRDSWKLKNIDSLGRSFVLTGNNSSYQLKTIKKLNLRFAQDSLHDIYDGEDVDFANQILLNGKTILFEPKIKVFHNERKSFRGFLKQQYRIGCSAKLIGSEWGRMRLAKQIFGQSPQNYQRFFSEYFLDLFLHPLVNKNYLLMLKLIVPFYLSKIAKKIGYSRMDRLIRNDISLPSYLYSYRPVLANDLISIAIVTRNRAQALKRCLYSVAFQTVYPSEIIVVDNDSKDNTKKVAEAFGKILPIKYVLEKKVGISNARNRALDEASKNILAFIDDDTQVNRNWIMKMSEAHGKFPSAVAIQGRSISIPRINTYSVIAEFNRLKWLLYSLRGIKNKKSNKTAKYPLLSFLDTKNISFKLAELRQLNLRFDSSLNRCEDIDFAKQIVIRKKQIRYVPSVQVLHYERSNVFSFIKQSFEKGVGFAKFSYKWKKKRTKNDNFSKSLNYFLKFISLQQRVRFPRLLFGFIFYTEAYELGKFYVNVWIKFTKSKY